MLIRLFEIQQAYSSGFIILEYYATTSQRISNNSDNASKYYKAELNNCNSRIQKIFFRLAYVQKQ